MANYADIIASIESSVRFLIEYEKDMKRQDYGDWEGRFLKETEKLIDRNLKIKKDNLLNFRGRQIFVSDKPSARFKGYYSSSALYYAFIKIFNWIWGQRRGEMREVLDSFCVVRTMNFLELLEKYPNSGIGHPLNIRYKRYCFTKRYLRHIYFLGLFKEYLEKELEEESMFLDIGSSYGIFSSLIKQEMKKTHHVLVDLPGQLILAHYYLAKLLPEVKIAGFKETGKAEKIDREFIRQFDFVLVPPSMYEKLTSNSVDVVTNFISLSEMTRYWFDAYIHSRVFKTAPFFFTVNRYDSHPTYHNDITVLDYPFPDYKTIYMRTCPFIKYYYEGFLFLLCKKSSYPSQLFQFIGKRHGL